MPVLLKLNRCFCHGLKMCMWFEYNPRINFYHFFRILNLVIFQAQILSKGIDSGYLVCATPPTVLCQSFLNFVGVSVMVWRCACGLDIFLRLFLSLFRHFKLSHFWDTNTIKVYVYWGHNPLNLFVYIVYCCENRLKINITPYGEFFYYSTYQERVTFFKSFYHKEIMGWTSGFPEITETSRVHRFEIDSRWTVVKVLIKLTFWQIICSIFYLRLK